MTLSERLRKYRGGDTGYRALMDEAADQLDGLEKAREIVELYFAPWGAAKGEQWEDLSGDQPFEPEVALRLIQRALAQKDPSHG